MRNFDPESLAPSVYVNRAEFVGYAFYGEQSDLSYYGGQYEYNFIDTFQVDTLQFATPVADSGAYLNQGDYFTGLSYDDVGGLAYLLSTNNVNYETLLPGITSAGTNGNALVNDAWRPGVDKITFVPQPVDSFTGQFLPLKDLFTDTYITNGSSFQQQLQRAITQPDFFCAGDVKYGYPLV